MASACSRWPSAHNNVKDGVGSLAGESLQKKCAEMEGIASARGDQDVGYRLSLRHPSGLEFFPERGVGRSKQSVLRLLISGPVREKGASGNYVVIDHEIRRIIKKLQIVQNGCFCQRAQRFQIGSGHIVGIHKVNRILRGSAKKSGDLGKLPIQIVKSGRSEHSYLVL